VMVITSSSRACVYQYNECHFTFIRHNIILKKDILGI